MRRTKSVPAVRRRQKAADKPPMPANLTGEAAKAVKRHNKRSLSPGVAVDVAKGGRDSYVVASPHSNTAAWEAMVCDALGTRSISTAQTFLYHLTELCSQNWHPAEVEGDYGEWCPDGRELNMILHMVAGIKPRNEMQAAQAAQMVAVHLMTMRVSAQALRGGRVVAEDAAIAGKLARTFVMQAEALAKLKGKRSSSRQTITVRQEKHVHNHQHVHLRGGVGGPDQSHDSTGRSRACASAAGQLSECPALPGPQQGGDVVPLRRDEGQARLPPARGPRGCAQG